MVFMNKSKKQLELLKQNYQQPNMSKEQVEIMKNKINNAKKENNEKKHKIILKTISAAAAVTALFILLPNTSKDIAYAMSNIPIVGRLVDVVTFRDYQYQSERNTADITVPELTATENSTDKSDYSSASTEQSSSLKKTTEEINQEIKEITDNIIAEFEENLKYEEGYQDVIVKSEVLNTTENYFTLKLICYQGSGSGAEWDYFYTIDLSTGERIQLADLFVDGADYITPISENIKKQMKEQMDADENVAYWLDNKDIPEWNFKQITDDTLFYLNENNNIVISFNEGDVAPMYMGCVEFEIPAEVCAEIRNQ